MPGATGLAGTAAGQTPSSTNAWLLGASYDLGVAKPYLAYERATAGATGAKSQDKGWSLGVAAPLGPVTVSVGWARETSRSAAAIESKVSGWGGQAVYGLSKRTNVYAEFMQLRVDANTAAAGINGKSSQFGVGMRHDF